MTSTNEKFMSFHRNAGTEPLKLIQSVDTRWKLIKAVDAVKSTAALIDKELSLINPDEWLQLKDLVTVLKTFEYPIKEISSRKYRTGSMDIHIVSGIKIILLLFSLLKAKKLFLFLTNKYYSIYDLNGL